MHIEKVTLRNVLSHADTTLGLPPSGVVALTGENGHGKSSIVEAVSVALWGTTLRGTTPWAKPDGHVYVRVRFGTSARASGVGVFHVTRALTRGKESLSFHEEGLEPVKYETTTKAQEALELLVGPHEVWRRASVFSSSDADSFSGATDGERKRMLESVLGVDRFEPALKACRADLQKAAHQAQVADRDHAVALERLIAATQRRDDAAKSLAASAGEDPAPLDVRLAELRGLLKQTDGDIAGMRGKLREGDRAGVEDAALARQLHQTLERLRGAKCPTCEQAIAPDHRTRLAHDAEAARARAESAARAAKDVAAAMEADFEELAQERETLAERCADAERRGAAAHAAAAQRATAERIVQAAEATIVEYREKAGGAHAVLMRAEKERGELEACERVLGLKGPRAQIVGRALGGLEAVANMWLGRVAGPEMRVKLSPFTETKSAGVNDKIAFDVVGAGNGHGYRASSGGERRRLDVALLLALGEFVAAANGVATGTLFADEVFDALDGPGRAAVSGVLHDLAAEGRCIVVITHLPAFVRELDPDEQWRVEGGVVARA